MAKKKKDSTDTLAILRDIRDIDEIVTSREQHLLFILLTYADANGQGIYPGYELLAKKMRMSIVSVKRLMASLQRKMCVIRDGKHGRCNEYHLCVSPNEQHQADHQGEQHQGDNSKIIHMNKRASGARNRRDHQADREQHQAPAPDDDLLFTEDELAACEHDELPELPHAIGQYSIAASSSRAPAHREQETPVIHVNNAAITGEHQGEQLAASGAGAGEKKRTRKPRKPTIDAAMHQGEQITASGAGAPGRADRGEQETPVIHVNNAAITGEHQGEQLAASGAGAGEKKRTRKPRKPTIDAAMQARIDAVYDSLDTLRREVTGDQEECYPRNEKSTRAIYELLAGTPKQITPEKLRRVYMAMWNEPRNERTGYWTREHMDIPYICKQYDTRAMALLASDR